MLEPQHNACIAEASRADGVGTCPRCGVTSITICGAARNAWFSVIDARRVVLTTHGEGAPESTHVDILNAPTDAILRAIKWVSP